MNGCLGTFFDYVTFSKKFLNLDAAWVTQDFRQTPDQTVPRKHTYKKLIGFILKIKGSHLFFHYGWVPKIAFKANDN